MTEFDKLNLSVVPIYNLEDKAPKIRWLERKSWCSWEERNDLYPKAVNWYVVPSHVATYFMNGVEIGYYVIDVDHHAGDKFEEAVDFLKQCGIPKSLTIRTPSGGLHIYYWATLDSIPVQVPKGNPTGLPIEIKTKTGVLAPNGRDRKVIVDVPVAYLSPSDNSLFSKLAKLPATKPLRVNRKPIDPNYKLPEPLTLSESQRHDTMVKEAKRLQDDGCPDSKILEWLKATREASPGSRRITDRELSDIIDWGGSGVDYNYDDIDKLLEESKKEIPSVSSPEPREATLTIEDDTFTTLNLEAHCRASQEPTEALTGVELVKSVFPGTTELEGWESIYAKSVFSTREETKEMIRAGLKKLPKEDVSFACGMLQADKMRKTWESAPHSTQVKYEYFKELVKSLLQ